MSLCLALLAWRGTAQALARSSRDAALLRAARELRSAAAPAAFIRGSEAFFWRAGSFPLRVGIQVGHWRQEEMPPELTRLREATGATAGGIREVDVNLAIARELAALCVAAGMAVDVLPATVPPGYLADAVVAIHADGAGRPTARGWKITTAWRASRASALLCDAVSETYAAFTGLPEDRYGITYGMKGYYVFSPQRVQHAVSSFSPCIIVETGFVTVAEDREVIVAQPGLVARGIAAGIIRYLRRRSSPLSPEGRLAYAPVSYPLATVAAAESLLRARAGEDEPLVGRLEKGTAVLPMEHRDGWTEVVVRGDFRRFGWLPSADLRPVD